MRDLEITLSFTDEDGAKRPYTLRDAVVSMLQKLSEIEILRR
jgi:hypothetical protein